jgi:hypothetical protein
MVSLKELKKGIQPIHFAENRGFQRAVYSKNYPTLIMNDKKYDVIDVSQRGIKFYKRDSYFSYLGLIKGKITFRNKKSFDLSGLIYRIENDKVAAMITQGVPDSIIKQECFKSMYL